MTEEAQPVDADLGLGGAVWEGDAFDLVGKLPDAGVDLILTSPPYWGLRTYGHTHNEDVLRSWTDAGLSHTQTPPYDWYRDAGGILGLEPYPQWYIEHLVEWFNRARQKLVAEGSVWVNLGDTYFARWSSIRDGGRQGFSEGRSRRKTPSGDYLHDKQLLMIPARFALAMQDAGWILRNDLIWSKEAGLPRPGSDRLRLSHEHWFHFVQRSPRGRPSYYYDISKVEPGARDVVVCATSNGTPGHTATFPPDIVRPRIASSSPIGGLVVDPFCGTGRALSESVAIGRRAIGFELSPQYATNAKLAIRQHLVSADEDTVAHTESVTPLFRRERA